MSLLSRLEYREVAFTDRTHDLVITFGPLDKPHGGKSLIAIAEQSHFTSQLTSGFRTVVRPALQ
jgi:hypothetical protein